MSGSFVSHQHIYLCIFYGGLDLPRYAELECVILYLAERTFQEVHEIVWSHNLKM